MRRKCEILHKIYKVLKEITYYKSESCTKLEVLIFQYFLNHLKDLYF